jgi:alkanesulfonate monooxygenase SsuD/methylene tetrahydromethanopterin reductase-like flavin-dependent oxidoreductase (luciferase family)
MPEEWLDLFSISGTPEDCALQIPKLIDAGATSVVLAPYPSTEIERMIDVTAKSLLPIL